nr:putative nuclease HARBI1 [Penaeus vannamei]
MPRRREEIQKIKQDFFAVCGFPNVLRAIDCTHIPIKAPRQEHLYLNRKRVHSLNVQVVSDANSRILSFSAKFPGRDSGYPLETCLMTPLAETRTAAEVRYNSSHARTRAVIEQTFGVLKTCCTLLYNICVKRGIPFHDILENDDPGSSDEFHS